MVLSRRPWFAVCILWVAMGLFAHAQGWTLGRYANTYEGEYAAHCWKTYDVEYGKEKVDACIARQLSQDENDTMWRQAIGSYASSAWKPLAIALSGSFLIFGFFATRSLFPAGGRP